MENVRAAWWWRSLIPTARTLIDDEAVAYHEGVPGHHMQISIAQTLEGLPKFRLHSFYPAYAEGWGALFRGTRQRDRVSIRTPCPITAG